MPEILEPIGEETKKLKKPCKKYQKVKIPGHPLSHADGQVYTHRFVLYNKIGPGDHNCHWCQKQISWDGKGIKSIVADHLDDDTQNNDPRNLTPSCRMCNSERAIRANFLTHCENGHEWIKENIYLRPDGVGRMCRKCSQNREKKRVRNQSKKVYDINIRTAA